MVIDSLQEEETPQQTGVWSIVGFLKDYILKKF